MAPRSHVAAHNAVWYVWSVASYMDTSATARDRRAMVFNLDIYHDEVNCAMDHLRCMFLKYKHAMDSESGFLARVEHELHGEAGRRLMSALPPLYQRALRQMFPAACAGIGVDAPCVVVAAAAA